MMKIQEMIWKMEDFADRLDKKYRITEKNEIMQITSEEEHRAYLAVKRIKARNNAIEIMNREKDPERKAIMKELIESYQVYDFDNLKI